MDSFDGSEQRIFGNAVVAEAKDSFEDYEDSREDDRHFRGQQKEKLKTIRKKASGFRKKKD